MKKGNLFLLIIVLLCLLAMYVFKGLGSSNPEPQAKAEKPTPTVYDFTVVDNQGKEVSLSEYKGKVLLIVNTATRCGHTPQYQELQDLYYKYNHKGFEILDFPCNQFAAQAPEPDEEIQKFCTLNYRTTFPRFHKINVNGDSTIALYDFLKHANVVDPDADVNIHWNFTKFLIGKDGKVLCRFETDQKRDILEPEIIEALK